MKEVLKWLRDNKASLAENEWSKQFNNPQDWWNSFERGDWMLWVIWRLYDCNDDSDLRKMVKVKFEIASQVRHLMTDVRSKKALRVADRFSRGEAMREELEDAHTIAAAAAAAAGEFLLTNGSAAVDAAAAHAAAYAVEAVTVYTAEHAVGNAAADTSNAEALAAAHATRAVARLVATTDAYIRAKKESLRKSAEIVRNHYKIEEILKKMKGGE